MGREKTVSSSLINSLSHSNDIFPLKISCLISSLSLTIKGPFTVVSSFLPITCSVCRTPLTAREVPFILWLHNLFERESYGTLDTIYHLLKKVISAQRFTYQKCPPILCSFKPCLYFQTLLQFYLLIKDFFDPLQILLELLSLPLTQ